MSRRQKKAVSPELEKLIEINDRLIRVESNLDDIKRNAARTGAIYGGLSGGLAGGVIALGIAFIKAKWDGF